MPHAATLRPGIVGPGEPGHRIFESNFVMECSCGERGNYATTNEKMAEAWMAEHLRRHEHTCEICQTAIVQPVHGPHKIYCSARCRYKAWYAGNTTPRVRLANVTMPVWLVERARAYANTFDPPLTDAELIRLGIDCLTMPDDEMRHAPDCKCSNCYIPRV